MPGESVITFDFYGTLVQWHETLEIAFREMLVRRGLLASVRRHCCATLLPRAGACAIHRPGSRTVKCCAIVSCSP